MGQSSLGINARVQVYKHRSIGLKKNKPLQRRAEKWGEEQKQGENKPRSFISIITIKNTIQLRTGF